MRSEWKTAGVLAAAASVVAVVLGDARPAQATPPKYDPSVITNWGSGLCLDVAHDADLYANGAPIQQWACTGEPRQLWRLRQSTNGGYELRYKIVNTVSGKCMDVLDGKNADRTPVQQWECRSTLGANSQTWDFDALVPTRIVSDVGGRCLDVYGGSLAEGAQLQIYHCTTNNPAQIFTRE